MSSGGKGASATSSRVSIPGSVKKTIENIKEITGQSHSDDEIYAMLKECSMDPNETAQKLLLLDKFHEVKRKHNRRKENLNKESTDSRWKPDVQAWTNKGGRGNYSSRYSSNDTSGGRNYTSVKENATIQISEKGVMPTLQESKWNETSVISPVTALSNGPPGMSSTSFLHETHATASRGVDQSDTTGDANTSKVEGLLPLPSPTDSIKNTDVANGTHVHQILKSSNSLTPINSATSSVARFSSSDRVLLPSQNIRSASAVDTIRHEMDSKHTPVEQIVVNTNEGKSASASVGGSVVPQMPNIFQRVGKNQHLESPKTASSTCDGSFVSRPSSNHNNRTLIGPQKVVPGKEWKPKSAIPSISQDASTTASSEVSTIVVKHSEVQPTTRVISQVTLEMQRMLEETPILDSQNVIIPNHLHVPDAKKLGFCFGSFDADFELDMSHNSGPKSDKSQPLSESPEAIEGTVKEPSPSQNELVTAEDTEAKYPDNPPTLHGLENFSSTEGEDSSSVLPEYNEPKHEVASGSHQHPVAQSSSSYDFGFMPPILSSQVSPSESSESQVRDASQVPSFVIQQSFDPTSYYLQLYRPSAHIDGRILPFHSAGAASKMLSALNLQSPQEGGVPLVLSTAAPTPLVTQATGVMQSSQQPLPVFRQPTGMHLPHYPPNYVPYSPYFSPYYVPPAAVHQFLATGALPQQPQAGSMYPTPPGATAKYSVSQFKQGPNAGNPTYMGVPGSYGPYGLSMANYTSSSATTVVTSTSNEDLAAHQVKENSLYVSGQQSEGSGVWFTTPSQDISSLQASSFYNLPQSQLPFTPTQPGHCTFAGMYHPSQAAATVHPLLQQSQTITSPVDMVGPPTSVYQQPQHTQLNWSSNY
ncbi:GBF-interacting 1-like isoform X1 [Olea europaea subsp. europaea]|uniref:GBF-interacting 1-like isoform X1 n=1 Tax=Olea europaea subsp. europaea TaxID=158383 RepID=A0A8S0U5Z3_OLEEU|nr:GBF-interacting 1-like isoform X1 [Olea europaea subsp. europaea]